MLRTTINVLMKLAPLNNCPPMRQKGKSALRAPVHQGNVTIKIVGERGCKKR